MKRPLPGRCLLALCVMASMGTVYAQNQEAVGDGSRYEHFMVYPHRQAGYVALRAGDERKAIAEFTRARSLAPHSVDTALDLAEAYRHFGHLTDALAVLEDQNHYTPNDPRLRAAQLPTATPAVDCRHDNRPVCRAKRGFDDLHSGDLASAQHELDAPDFAHSAEQRTLRHAFVQRAINLGDDRLAVTQLAELDAHDTLSTQEREQWFTLLLKLGDVDGARKLQARDGMDAPEHDLAIAQALANSHDVQELAAYMGPRQPAFTNAEDERQWLSLLAMVGHRQPALLDHYVVRYPSNLTWQAQLSLPLAMARDDHVVAQRMLAHLPAGRFREDRFSLELAQGQYAEAEEQAQAMVAQPGGYRLLDPLSYRLLQAGAGALAKQLLLDAYPFTGYPDSAALFDRLAVLADQQPALFLPDDRTRLRQPLPSTSLRIAQMHILGALRDCEGIRTVMADRSPDYPSEQWRQLGDCYGNSQPGLAEYAYIQAGKHSSDEGITRALAYQAYNAQDYATAMQAWQSVPTAHMQPADMLAAATTALTIHQNDVARSWLDGYAAQGGKQDDAYWWLRAQVDAARDPALARSDLERAIALRPDARYYARLAELQTKAGDAPQALVSLQHAVALAPDDSKLGASLGYAYLQAGEPSQARAQFERVHSADPDDPALTRQLLYVSQQLGDTTQAKLYAEQAIDQFDSVNDTGTHASDGSAQQDEDDLFALRRTHENLDRTWSVNADMSLGDTVASAANAVAPGVSYRSYAQLEAQYHFDPQLTGGDVNTLAAYTRLFAGSGTNGSVWPVHEAMLGVGVHWKPLTSQNIVLSIEQQTPADNSRDTHNDTMLRASGSWSFGSQLSDDWHASGRSWFTQNFYVDFAHYLRAKQSVLTLDYRFGLQRKLEEGQTIEPYVHAQYTGLDRSNGLSYTRDARAGVGVQWNVWYGQTRYDAYPHRFSVAVEGQHAFTSYLRERNAVFLIARVQW